MRAVLTIKNGIPRKLATLGLAALASLCLAIPGCRTNPVTGEDQFILISPEQELKMGHQYHPNIVFMYDGEYQDPELKRYLGSITKRVHECSHRSDMSLDFTIVNTSMINAFAIPGHVYCTRGLLAEFENEAQFAAIMGHEIGHVAAMHSARQMTTDMLIGLGAVAASAALEGEDNGQLMLTAGLLGAKVLGLSYSREQERQADRLGAYYMALAGWDPREAIAAQRLIESLGDHRPNFLAKYLSTHPQTDDRVGEIRSLIQEKQLLDRGVIQGDGIYRDRWQGRLAGLVAANRAFEPYDKGVEMLSQGNFSSALTMAEQAVSKDDSQAPFHRLKGDALLGLKRRSEAREAYSRALQDDPRYVPANAGLGKVALAEKNYDEAEQQFAKAVAGFPTGLEGLWGLGKARFRQAEYRQAAEPLKSVVGMVGGKVAEPSFLLAVCYDRLGLLRPALDQYRLALSSGLSGDPAKQARLRADKLDAHFAKKTEEK